ncbi:MAG: PIN domain-containing protein [Desulfobacteraceae bacterium]
MSGKVFVDTNILVYGRDLSEPEKQRQALAWMAYLWQRRTGRLSFQVLQEFYVTVTAKLRPGLEQEVARRDVRALLAWEPLVVNARVIEAAWELQDRYGLPWWDALIATAAQAARCRYLLTENFQDRQNLGDLLIVNPFCQSPESLEA